MGDLTPEELAALRKGVRLSLQQGHKVGDIDAFLKQNYGMTSKQVMEPNPRDFGRSVLQGLTLNHGGQVAGAAAALTGGDYSTTRDQFKENQAQSMGANPIANTAVQMASGVVPALAASMIPGMAPVEGAGVMNMLRGAAQGGGAAAAMAHGNDQPIASLPVAASAVLGGVGGALASKMASRGLPGGNARAVEEAAASQLPSDPIPMQQAMARQEALAPGTVVLADANPQMRSIVKLVGADPKTGALVREDALQRYRILGAATRGVGVNYEELKGQMAPVDPDLLSAMATAGKKLPKGATEVDLADIHDVRSRLLAEARATRNAHVSQQKTEAAQSITDWMVQQAPFVKQLDSDYAFLKSRLMAAKQTLKAVTQSSSNYATAKAGGIEPASAGAAIPTTLRSAAGVVLMNKIGAPDRAARAKAVASLLLSPSRSDEGLAQLVRMHGILMNPPGSPMLAAGTALAFGDAVPRLAGAVLAPQTP